MYIERLGFDPDTVQKLSFVEMLKRIGPGIILTGVVIGPGPITTAAMLGANYGYAMLWLFIPIFLMGITFMLTCYRISMLTGMPIIHAIRHYYGKGAAAFVGICLFLEGCECRIETTPAAADCHDRMLSVYPGNYDLRHLQEILKKRENCGNHSRFSFFVWRPIHLLSDKGCPWVVWNFIHRGTPSYCIIGSRNDLQGLTRRRSLFLQIETGALGNAPEKEVHFHADDQTDP